MGTRGALNEVSAKEAYLASYHLSPSIVVSHWEAQYRILAFGPHWPGSYILTDSDISKEMASGFCSLQHRIVLVLCLNYSAGLSIKLCGPVKLKSHVVCSFLGARAIVGTIFITLKVS